MSIMTIEHRDLLKKNYIRTIGGTIDSSDAKQQEISDPMVKVKDDFESTNKVEHICYNGKWFTITPNNDQIRLEKEWKERAIN